MWSNVAYSVFTNCLQFSTKKVEEEEKAAGKKDISSAQHYSCQDESTAQ